jgi:hypothetical protein
MLSLISRPCSRGACSCGQWLVCGGGGGGGGDMTAAATTSSSLALWAATTKAPQRSRFFHRPASPTIVPTLPLLLDTLVVSSIHGAPAVRRHRVVVGGVEWRQERERTAHTLGQEIVFAKRANGSVGPAGPPEPRAKFSETEKKQDPSPPLSVISVCGLLSGSTSHCVLLVCLCV